MNELIEGLGLSEATLFGVLTVGSLLLKGIIRLVLTILFFLLLAVTLIIVIAV